MTLNYTILLILAFSSSTLAQSIFIDGVPEYSQLATCAEQPLSVIVRSMASGCGDGSKTTSYACFCSSSSSKFSSIISREVIKTCSGNSDDASSALDVFSSYCQIGTTAIPTGSGEATGALTSPTPANTASIMVTSTADPTAPGATALSSSNTLTRTSKIVIGVIVPVGLFIIIGGIIAAALVVRAHRRHIQDTTEDGVGAKNISTDTSTDHGSSRSLSPTITTKFHFELESPVAEKLEKPAPVELPTDGRYGNGTSAHELQE